MQDQQAQNQTSLRCCARGNLLASRGIVVALNGTEMAKENLSTAKVKFRSTIYRKPDGGRGIVPENHLLFLFFSARPPRRSMQPPHICMQPLISCILLRKITPLRCGKQHYIAEE